MTVFTDTQREAAERFNVAQPRISEIYQGEIESIQVIIRRFWFCRTISSPEI